MNQEDKKLVARAKQDPREFAALYKKYADDVFNYLWYRTGHNNDLAEDLMQEVFARAFRHLPKFRQRGYSYRTYLLTIARNLLINHFRRAPFVPLDEARRIPAEITQEQTVARRLAAENLWRAMQDLSVNERDAVLLHYRDGMPIKDIARVMKKSPNAVKINLSRARAKLRKHPFLQDMGRYANKVKTHARPRFLQQVK
jgi:RNA polymerase sigma-70 factor (ECF subfamily)